MIRLYPTVAVKGKSFKATKRCVVPNQSMSLREIIQRFVRRESLPVSKEGVYEERFGDVEKMRNEDIVDIQDRTKTMKSQLDDFDSRQKKRIEKQKQDKIDAEKLAQPTKPGGEPPVKNPPS